MYVYVCICMCVYVYVCMYAWPFQHALSWLWIYPENIDSSESNIGLFVLTSCLLENHHFYVNMVFQVLKCLVFNCGYRTQILVE